LTTVAFSTLPASMRGEGTGLYNLSRNIGSSVGISVVTALITSNTQVNHAAIASYVTPFNHAFQAPEVMRALNPLTAAGRAALDSMITLQSVIIAYIDDFKLLMILSIVAMPLVLLLRRPATPAALDHSAVVE
jgi:DHA2 family multidrug resistance protein